MAYRALALRSLLLPEPLHHLSLRAAASAPAAPFPCRRRRRNCSSSIGSGAGDGDQTQPPQEAVLEAISKVAMSKGRVALTTNMVIGGTVTDDSSDEWLVLDQKVNTYPTDRGFTAIGTGGEDFVHSMVDAVESVLQESIPKGQVSLQRRPTRDEDPPASLTFFGVLSNDPAKNQGFWLAFYFYQMLIVLVYKLYSSALPEVRPCHFDVAR